MRNLWKSYGLGAYLLAAAAIGVSVLMTRLTWPLFMATPLIPAVAAILVTTHWGGGTAGLVGIALALATSSLAVPPGIPSWDARTQIFFIVVGFIANRVLHARNRAESALRASEAENRATWEHAAFGSAQLNQRGYVERVNPAFERMFNAPANASRGMAFSAFTDPQEVEAEQKRLAALLAGSESFYQREQQYRRHDGSLFWGRVTVSPIRRPEGITGAIAVIEDITVRRQAELDLQASEARLRRAQKMEVVGQLAAGVAHNFNNLLTVIGGCADLLLDRHRDDREDRGDLDEIRRASERGALLTRQLLAVGRKYTPVETRVDVNRTVASLREMVLRVIREDIELTTTLAPEPAVVLIDPHDLDQVVLNLVINARDALPMGGTIDVDVSHESGDYVRLRVRDSGTGMTPDVQSHLFEPFFTTKDVGEGTGLGLAFVQGVVRHARGFVTVDSSLGKGTIVSVYFPAVSAPAVEPAAEQMPAAGQPARSDAMLLLVEDEDSVRKATERLLTRAGYRVLSAATPAEAERLFAQHATDIDVLITDIVMPGMNGPTLAQHFVALRPQLRVLFMSGYSDSIPAATVANPKVAFLAKPFPASRLVGAVADLLSAPAGRA